MIASHTNRLRHLALGCALALLPVSCNLSSSTSGGGMIGDPDELLTAPNGSQLFFNDSNEGGAASRLRLTEMFWGRQVDVFGLDLATGLPEIAPRFVDMVVNENIQSGLNYVLDTNPITQETRLIVQRSATLASGDVNPQFRSLVDQLESGLPPIQAKNDDGTASAPFSFLARNATLVLRFDDLLDDSAAAEANLPFTVQVLQGYPPTIPFSPRMRFDPNHGGIRDGDFHSTRLLIDMTISEAELAGLASAQPVNTLGLQGSLETTNQPNVSVRIPTQEAGAIGQFSIFRSVTGKPLAEDNGPIDNSLATRPLVRAIRAGNTTDQNNGFLLDLNSPEIIGEWPILVSNVLPQDADGFGFATLFDVRVNFDTDCKDSAAVGDIIQVNSTFLEILQANGLSGGGSDQLNGLSLRSLSGPVQVADIVGSGAFLSTFDPALFTGVGVQCWMSITPVPVANSLAPDATIQVRFSEPMDPASILPFDTMLVVRGDVSGAEPGAEEIVIGDVNASADLQRYTFEPSLPLSGSQFHMRLLGDVDGVTDLAGNPISQSLPFVALPVTGQPALFNGGFVLRFDSTDELKFNGPTGSTADGFRDLRGQFFYDFERGVIKPRPVSRASYQADRTNPVPAVMIPFPPGVQTPLSPLGSKLQTVWRYCDLGFSIQDETVFNLDVEGLNWAPIGGSVVADFYTDFEMRLSHSNRLPDEMVNMFLLPAFPNSGLRFNGQQYAQNIANNNGALDSLINTAQRVMHPRALGYQVNPVDLFLASTGTLMMPFPLNTNENIAKQYYTWRDTTMSVRTAPLGTGIPTGIEADDGTLSPSPLNLYASLGPGDIAPSGRVPAFGLPLLMEFRCYPSNTGIGLNAFDISLAINSSARPNFRAYSTGGTNVNGVQVNKDPDLELAPTGGFNPTSTPPGQATAQDADNSFYIGQVDTVTRVSIVHTIWFDAGASAEWLDPLFEPRPNEQPTGTQVRFDFRGATGISGAALTGVFDASLLGPHGDLNTDSTSGDFNPSVTFANGDVDIWETNLGLLDGSRFVQVRMAFMNNVDTGLNPELSAFGFAYELQ